MATPSEPDKGVLTDPNEEEELIAEEEILSWDDYVMAYPEKLTATPADARSQAISFESIFCTINNKGRRYPIPQYMDLCCCKMVLDGRDRHYGGGLADH